MPESLPEIRTRKVEEAVSRFYDFTQCPENQVVDILTDLRHFCDTHGLDFDALSERSARYYRNEAADAGRDGGV